MNDPHTRKQGADLERSWAETDADLRWVLAHVQLDPRRRREVEEWLDHNELGLAWEDLDVSLPNRSPEVADRMESARLRMGLPSGDIRER